ncbi:aldo/keto reductase family protein [Hirsutella rhossiliensis]|uniref:Aldo/keto reductase family domain-containing protein n=1 Tax=Hirsutella rhossiliensis TaxID=111463 RepID=A0A9P8N4J3_9HYPO|nr:aldo/keto reductase family domain-containing protein [Hirsutella rhossiliensis]KAH0967498.1 aldo/keto reductase family domain-containing protein [Hirsutella rhossiliensis]
MSRAPPAESGLGPLMIYGTAWKENKTEELTESAMEHGFSGVDTANYPTAYNEPLAGKAIAAALRRGLKREHLFIQSKFTPVWAHDKDRIPFNPDQDIEGQVRESIAQTLKHLEVGYVDALLLHVPFEKDDDNITAWKVFETFVPERIRYLGVSNIHLPQLQSIYAAATVKPVIVQNRFYKETSFDLDVRTFCADHCITYQAFWMLAHNPKVLESAVVSSVADKLQVEKGLAFYVLILCLGNTQVLNGTTKTERMAKDTETIKLVFEDAVLLKELEPSVADFKKLLWELASKNNQR